MCRGRHLADDCVDRAEGEKEVNDRALYQLASPHKDTKVALRGFSFCDVGIAARVVASGENGKVPYCNIGDKEPRRAVLTSDFFVCLTDSAPCRTTPE